MFTAVALVSASTSYVLLVVVERIIPGAVSRYVALPTLGYIVVAFFILTYVFALPGPTTSVVAGRTLRRQVVASVIAVTAFVIFLLVLGSGLVGWLCAVLAAALALALSLQDGSFLPSLQVPGQSRTAQLFSQCLGAVPVVGFLIFLGWVANENLAFTGVHRIEIANPIHAPRSVQFNPAYELGMLRDGSTTVTRPFRDRIDFSATLPRGFDTVELSLAYQSDASTTISLQAGGSLNHGEQNVTFRHPQLVPGDRKVLLEGDDGRVYVPNDFPSSPEDFWRTTFSHEKTIGIGPRPANLIVLPSTFADYQKFQNVPIEVRGSFSITALLGPKSSSLTFVKRDLNYSAGDDTLSLTLLGPNNFSLTQSIGDSDRAKAGDFAANEEEISVSLPALPTGIYVMKFSANNVDSVVHHVRYYGGEPQLSGDIFFADSQDQVSLYTQCSSVIFEAVKQSGTQSVTVGGKVVSVATPKQPVKHALSAGTPSIVIAHGGIAVRSKCGFQLQPELAWRLKYDEFLKNFKVVSSPLAANLVASPVILDSFKLPATKGEALVASVTFDTKELVIRNRTINFTISAPNASTKDGHYLHVKSITITARRAPFQLSDIAKAVQQFGASK